MNTLYYTSIAMVMLVLVGSVFRNRVVRGIGYAALITIPLYSIAVGGPWDSISSIMAILAAVVGFASSMYTDGYEEFKYGGGNLHMLIDVFSVSVYATFTAINIVLFIVCWLIAELIGFFTIVYEVGERTLTAGLRYIAVSMIPSDMALMTFLASLSTRITVIEALFTPISDVGRLLVDLPPILYGIMMLGFIAKAAVIPLHFWLPDAHSLAPAPASAILSGVMVKMGVYGVLRILPSVSSVPILATFLFFGVLTSIYGGLLAIAQSDIKRVLAYSTIEHTGLIITALTLHRMYNITVFLEAALIMVCSHALYKAALFLNSGSVEVYTHTRDISRLGYLAQDMPAEALSALISILSLIGVPPTIGFIAKLLLLTALVHHLIMNPALGTTLIALVSVAIALAAVYSIKYATVYWGTWRSKQSREEAVLHTKLLKRLTIWEYIPAWLGVVGAPPIAIAILGVEILKLELLTPLALAMVLFLALAYYIYMRLRAASRDTQWLGGAVP